MSELYHQLRVDHILGFFRIWEIPRDTCVRGLLGHFFPSNPLTRQELVQIGLWDIERYVKPYIRGKHLQEKFPNNFYEISRKFFVPRNISKENDTFDFKSEYNTERKIYDAVMKDKTLDENEKNVLIQKLFELLGNVLLIEDPENPDTYHVRTELKKESVESTPNGPIIHWSTSWQELPGDQRQRFEELYLDFTYRRQTELWVSKAEAKLKVLKDSTNMLICAEDLGQITSGIIKSIEDNSLLSLRVQRMSKDPNFDFDDFNKFSYLSVACPSTHDTSTLRGWWEENSSVRFKFWYGVLARHEPCPDKLSTYFQEVILRQNLWSNSMWAIFLLQDLTGINDNLRRQHPCDERINNPADPNHKWRYRYPFTLEKLNDHKSFMMQMRKLAEDSHRI
ncbi:4-alpha-glucanotransferase, putative [Trichomonas vaginalis G3]|uniref:4-alpha-glucanotransferase n=1 Tax=Trichomonas vaginalis (strain ATCC PRA-98 / G3) TaxID=412133 RepID=A2E0S8_TRIV3|nr:heteropolysaccharide binding [Trichomonas vaginalis G3]EAY13683.1 4-alpha-glucanotransferase, putative [Trichomonas vaginalis G3]KAI5529593.1 heteropolysaccharide binding [Trichomonas vaginalis G3]|eukprot:XP_001325906.1 4-alpha-glucanotransferase [Trichomonas vaginalis G3]